MSHTSKASETPSSKVAKPSAQPEAKNTGAAEETQGPRRSERTRTLTEKGKEFQEERLKVMQRKYRLTYEKWRYNARLSKEILRDDATEEDLKDLMESINSTCTDIKNIYEELRCIQTPESDLRCRVDICVSLSGFIIQRAERQLEGHTADEEDEPWPDVESILDSNRSLSNPRSQRTRFSSAHCSIRSAKRNEAVAEVAASQEVLAVLEEQEKETIELQRLEAEEKLRLVQFETETLARQQAMQDKRRRLERLEEVKTLNAAFLTVACLLKRSCRCL